MISKSQLRLLGYLAVVEHATTRQCASAVYLERPHVAQHATVTRLALSLVAHGLAVEIVHGVWQITDDGRNVLATPTHEGTHDEQVPPFEASPGPRGMEPEARDQDDHHPGPADPP